MDKKIQEIFNQLEQEKQLLFEKLDKLDANLLLKKSNNGGWSVVQVISHLDKVESGTCQYIEKKTSGNIELKKSGPLVKVKGWILRWSLRLPIKFKADSRLEEASNSITYEAAKTQWTANRAAMKRLLEKLSFEQLNAPIFKNFSVGYISITEHMKFLRAHLLRHLKQIDNITKDGL